MAPRRWHQRRPYRTVSFSHTPASSSDFLSRAVSPVPFHTALSLRKVDAALCLRIDPEISVFFKGSPDPAGICALSALFRRIMPHIVLPPLLAPLQLVNALHPILRPYLGCPGATGAEVTVAACDTTGADSDSSAIDVGDNLYDLSSLSKRSSSSDVSAIKPCEDVAIVEHPSVRKPVRRRSHGRRVLNGVAFAKFILKRDRPYIAWSQTHMGSLCARGETWIF